MQGVRYLLLFLHRKLPLEPPETHRTHFIHDGLRVAMRLHTQVCPCRHPLLGEHYDYRVERRVWVAARIPMGKPSFPPFGMWLKTCGILSGCGFGRRAPV